MPAKAPEIPANTELGWADYNINKAHYLEGCVLRRVPTLPLPDGTNGAHIQIFLFFIQKVNLTKQVAA